MKKILLFLTVSVVSLTGFSQAFIPGQPGFTSAPELFDQSGNPTVNPNALNVTTPLKLRIGFSNASFAWYTPDNTTQIQIDLGNKMIVNPSGAYVLANAPLNQYFLWTLSTNGSNQVIVGTQKSGIAARIPAGFNGTLEFEVQASALGTSSIVGNITYPNTNPAEKTTDPVDGDNTTSSAYNVTTALPVKFVSVDAKRSGCTVNVNWSVAEQQNAASYSVEASRDGSNFVSVSSVAASGASAYSTSFGITDNLKADVLYVRVREVDADGRTTLSEVHTVSGNCDASNRLVIFGYPNPVTSTSYITIAAKDGVFDGKYKLQLFDNNGKLYQVKEAELNGVRSVQFDFNTTLTPGNYMIRVSTLDGTSVGTVQFIKVGVL